MKIPHFRITASSVVNVVGVVVLVYLMIVLGETVKRNYTLGRQIDDLKTQISQLQSQNDQLTYQIQYYGTDSFREKEARSKLGLQAPGENVVIIPHASPAPTTSAPTQAGKTAGPQSNLQQWLTFLGGKS